MFDTQGIVDVAAEVVERHQAVEVNGVLLDVMTARAITTLAGGLNDANREKLNAMDPVRAGETAWLLIGGVGYRA